MKKLNSVKEFATYFSKKHSLIITYLLSFAVAWLVFFTGGTYRVFANFMYVPIVFAAATAGRKQSIFLALCCGLLVGPFMPLNTRLQIMQHPADWLFRILVYVLVATIAGYYADEYWRSLEKAVKKQEEIIEAQLSTIYSLVKLSETRDDDTGEHIQRVAEYCKLLAIELMNNPQYSSYINDRYVDNLHKVSPLHDVGKVAIPDSILLKPGKLSPEEFEVVKSHTTIGAKTLAEAKKHYPNNQFLEFAVSIAYSHHEKWDGSGYPVGLKGKEIPLSGRIMALADVYDALRSKRVYKPGYPHEKCVEIIKADAGTHFDPEVVEAFLLLEDEFNQVFSKKTTI